MAIKMTIGQLQLLSSIFPAMTVKELISYEIVHAKDFPAVKFGKRIVIIRTKAYEWLESNIGKEF